MSAQPYNVLFLCTGNSARSILAEALLNRDGGGRFRAFSAGSFPKGQVHPMALDVLSHLGFDLAGLRSKSWDEFAAPDAPPLDFIFTVCDNAAGEVCPVWPGQPMTAHWGIEDPAALEGPGQRQAFLTALHYLRNRISLFLNLPVGSLDRMSLQHRLDEIGATRMKWRIADPALSPLAPGERAAMIAALGAAGLPASDLDTPALTAFGYADEKGPLAWAAWERRGPDALLRSVLTVETRRKSGIGADLIGLIGRAAAEAGIERLWLLTETAALFFAKLGFSVTERENAPEAIRDTTEFRSLCPASATCMMLALPRA